MRTLSFVALSVIYNSLYKDSSICALRIVKDEFCQKLILLFGKAIVSTSANISGEIAPKQFSEISQEIKKNVDYIGNLRQNEMMSTPSSILMINEDNKITKIR